MKYGDIDTQLPAEDVAEQKEEISWLDITGDSKRSAILGALLDRDGEDALGEKIMRKKYDDIDKADIDKYRKEVQEVEEKTKEIVDMVNPETIAGAAKHDNDFKFYVNQVGIDNTSEVVKTQLAILYVKDINGFNDLAAKIKTYKDGIARRTEREGKIQELCDEWDVSSEELDTAMDIASPKKRKKAVEKLVKEGTGNWFTNTFFHRKKIAKRTRRLNTRADIQNEITKRQDELTDLGAVLKTTVEQDDVMDIYNKVLGGETAEDAAAGRMSYREAQGAYPSDEDIERYWNEYKTQQAAGYDYAADPDDKKAEFVSNLCEGENYVLKDKVKKEGFWATIAKTVIRSWMNRDKKAEIQAGLN